MENEAGFPVLDKFKIIYKGKEVLVELVELAHPVPTQYFYICHEEGETLLNRFQSSMNKDIWLSGGNFSLKESRELGMEIESQLNMALPFPPSRNPFEYQGPIPIMVYSCQVGEVSIKESKAPFHEDVYYKIQIEDKAFTIIDGNHNGNRSWINEDNLSEKDFELLKSIVIDCKRKMPWIAD